MGVTMRSLLLHDADAADDLVPGAVHIVAYGRPFGLVRFNVDSIPMFLNGTDERVDIL